MSKIRDIVHLGTPGGVLSDTLGMIDSFTDQFKPSLIFLRESLNRPCCKSDIMSREGIFSTNHDDGHMC